MRRIAAALALALLAGACAKDGGSFVEAGRPAGYEASTEYLASAIDDSEGVSHRYEATMALDFLGESVDDVPVITGAVDGDRSQMRMDLGAMFTSMIGSLGEEGGDIPAEMLGDEMSMEMLVDGDVIYIRAPFFATMSELVPEGEGLDIFSELEDDEWAKVDLSEAAGLVPSDVADQLNSGQTMDPSQFLDVVAGAESVEDLGADVIDGEPVTGMAATVNFGDMLEAQGTAPDAFEDDEVAGLLEELAFDVEVWLDGDGHVRRLTMDMGAGMEALAEETGENMPGDMGMSITFDFFDYGESVEIEIPAEDEVVDVTEDWVEMADDLGD